MQTVNNRIFTLLPILSFTRLAKTEGALKTVFPTEFFHLHLAGANRFVSKGNVSSGVRKAFPTYLLGGNLLRGSHSSNLLFVIVDKQTFFCLRVFEVG